MITNDAAGTDPVDAGEEDAVLKIHKEMVRALRKCKPNQRRWLRALPNHDWSEYHAGVALGHSKHTVFRWLRQPHIRRYIELQREVDMIEIGINNLTILRGYKREAEADVRKLLDPQTGKIKPPGEWPEDVARCVTEYGFDKNGAPYVRLAGQLAARDRLAKWQKMFTERHEVTGKDGAPLAAALPIIQVVPYADMADAAAAGSAD